MVLIKSSGSGGAQTCSILHDMEVTPKPTEVQACSKIIVHSKLLAAGSRSDHRLFELKIVKKNKYLLEMNLLEALSVQFTIAATLK